MEQKRCPGCMRIKTQPVCEHCGFQENTPNAPHQLSVGTVLKEQYRIGRVLGQGGFGITYLGWDLYLDIPVAIKEYYPSGMVMRDTTVTMAVSDITGDQGDRFRNSRDRFLREAKMLARFSQMNEVVQVKNFFLANNTAYIVMEYVEGITLKQYVKQKGGALTPEEAFAILGPVVRTLSKVHKTGIIHRDISPENIMMLPGGGAKLLDFGAVRSVGAASVDKELTKSTEAILKQGYAPLEQYQKKGALGPWTDVYALCATIYYCLTGTVPPDAPARVLEYEELNLNRLTALTQEQIAALSHGLELRAENRTPDMDTLYRELLVPVEKPLITPEPKPEPQPHKEQPRKRRKRKGSPIIVLVAVLALLALGAAVWYGFSGLGDTPPAPPGQPTASFVDSGTCGANIRWTLDEEGVLTLTGAAEMYNYYAEWYNDDLRQGKTMAPWMDRKDQITKVVIGDHITRVGDAAFYGCSNLTEVEIGSYVLSIGMDAFMGTGLTEVTLPESLNYIAVGAFESTPLRNVVIPDSVEAVEHYAFGNCWDLESVTLGVNTRLNFDIWNGSSTFNRGDGDNSAITLRGPRGGMVEDYAALWGHAFEAVGETLYEKKGYFGDLPTGGTVSWFFDYNTHYLRIVGQGPMAEDLLGAWELDQENAPEHKYAELSYQPWREFREEIFTVYIDDRITNIPPNCFENCHNLTDIYIGSSVETIGFQAFLATNVDEIVLPESVREIDNFAFNYCRNLRLAVLPLGLRELRTGTFNMCDQLQELYVGNMIQFERNERHPANPFSNGPEEQSYSDHLTIYSPQGEENGVLSYPKHFAQEMGWNYEEGIFGYQNAQQTGQMVFGESDTYWALQDGVLTLLGQGETPFYRSQGGTDRRAWGANQPGWMRVAEEAPWYPYREEIHTVIAQPGITALNRGALCDMPNLGYVKLWTVERLYTGAIDNCGMEVLMLDEMLHTIYDGAVVNCRNLRHLEVHNGNNGVGHGAFRGNTALEALYFFGGSEEFNGDLFDGEGPESLTITVRPDSPALQYAKDHGYPYNVEPW